MLSDLLARFGDEAAAEDALASLGDLRLIAALRQRAEAQGLGLGTFAADAVRRYMDWAPDEEWVTLLGELHRSTDPARVSQSALSLVRWAFPRDVWEAHACTSSQPDPVAPAIQRHGQG